MNSEVRRRVIYDVNTRVPEAKVRAAAERAFGQPARWFGLCCDRGGLDPTIVARLGVELEPGVCHRYARVDATSGRPYWRAPWPNEQWVPLDELLAEQARL